MPKGIPNKRYTPEFKVLVVDTMRKKKLSCREAARRKAILYGYRRSWKKTCLQRISDRAQRQHT